MRLKIALFCPTDFELEALKGVNKDIPISYFTIGYGPPQAAFSTCKILCRYDFDLVLLCGIAGIYKDFDNYKKEIFIASEEIFGDLGRCDDNLIEPIEIKGMSQKRKFYLDKNIKNFLGSSLKEFFITPMVTVSCSSGDYLRSQMIFETTKAPIENMEGASCALVCEHFKVPLIEMRTASNISGVKDKSQWDIDGALKRLSRGIEKLFDILKEYD